MFKIWVTCVCLAAVLIGQGIAAESKDPECQRCKTIVLEKFDTDGDGELSDGEKKAMYASWKERTEDWKKKAAERKKEFMIKYDKDGDGKLDDKEKSALGAVLTGKLLDKIDKNDDGKLNVDEVPERHRKHFGKTDKNSDGYVDKDELHVTMAKAHQAWRKKAAEHKNEFMEKYDKDGDGKLDAKEKSALGAVLTGKLLDKVDKNDDGKLNVDEVSERHRKHFGKTDKNSDGYVDKDELHAAMAKAHEAWRKKAAEHRQKYADAKQTGFMDLDKNGDGKLNVDEVGSRLRSKFSDVDTNGDGYIDEAEIKKRLSGRRGGRHRKQEKRD